MDPMTIALAVNTGLQAYGYFANRPKKPKPDTSYIDRYIANLRSDLASRRLERNILRETALVSGDAARQQREQAEYQAFRTGIQNTGLHVAQEQVIHQQQQQGIATASQQAMQQTAQQTAQTKQAVREAQMQAEQIRTQAMQQYRAAKEQHDKTGWIQPVSSAISLAGSYYSGVQKDVNAWKDAFEIAKATGQVAANVTYDTWKSQQQVSSPDMALKIGQYNLDERQSEELYKQLVKQYNLGPHQPAYNPKLSYQDNIKTLNAAVSQKYDTIMGDVLHTTYFNEKGLLRDFNDIKFDDIYREAVKAGATYTEAIKIAKEVTKLFKDMSEDQFNELQGEQIIKNLGGLKQHMTEEAYSSLEADVKKAICFRQLSFANDSINDAYKSIEAALNEQLQAQIESQVQSIEELYMSDTINRQEAVRRLSASVGQGKVGSYMTQWDRNKTVAAKEVADTRASTVVQQDLSSKASNLISSIKEYNSKDGQRYLIENVNELEAAIGMLRTAATHGSIQGLFEAKVEFDKAINGMSENALKNMFKTMSIESMYLLGTPIDTAATPYSIKEALKNSFSAEIKRLIRLNSASSPLDEFSK